MCLTNPQVDPEISLCPDVDSVGANIEHIPSGNEYPTELAAADIEILAVPKDKKSTWPFNPNDANFTNPVTFVNNLYLGNGGDGKPWMTSTEGRQKPELAWMAQRIGNADLVPELPKEPVQITTNPAWQWAEIWRPLNTYNALRTTGQGRPVEYWLNRLPSGNLSLAMFPNKLRDALKNNEKAIVSSQKKWVGNVDASAPYKVFPGVTVPYVKDDIMYFQKGSIGPVSFEAAFILATQMAGISWYDLENKITPAKIQEGIYWVSGILPTGNRDETITEYRENNTNRVMGVASRPGTHGMADHDPDAGMYLVLDIDPDIDGWKNDKKNVFVFAVHAIDNHSRLQISKPQNLVSLSYEYYTPGSFQPAPGPDGTGTNVRFYAHAHAAVMNYQVWMNWIARKEGDQKKMPTYSQIGEQHIYFLIEVEDTLWPRKKYVGL